MQSCLLVLMVLPVVAKDGEGVRDAVTWMLHLQLYRVLAIVHLFVVFGLLDGQDSLLSIWLLRVDTQDHVVGNQSFLRLLASLVQYSKVIPDLPKLVLQGGCLCNVLERLVDLAHVVKENG